jgi:serine/threonine protein kinase
VVLGSQPDRPAALGSSQRGIIICCCNRPPLAGAVTSAGHPRLLQNPVVKICDFGYSKSCMRSSARSRVGTITYMAPEVRRRWRCRWP